MRLTAGPAALAVAFTICLLPAGPGAAQDAVILPLAPNAAYHDAIRFRNIQSDLFYVDRNFGGLPMDQMPRPPAPTSQEDAPTTLPGHLLANFNRLLLIVFLGLVGFVVYKFGGRARDGLTRADAGKRGAERRAQTADEPRHVKRARTQELIARLLDMEDREAAMVELIYHVLDAAARQHDLRLGRSETARDFLRRLPHGWPHLADMRRIVIAEELVQFGGRPLISRTFEDCLRRATPILDGARA